MMNLKLRGNENVRAGERECQGRRESTEHMKDGGSSKPPCWFPRPLAFRKPGSPAGSAAPCPWFVSVFYDPYERVNFWSHAVPGLGFVILGMTAYQNMVLGGSVLAMFCASAATTHILSAITHVWPDSHFWEKIDHIGIVVLILGIPLTALLAKDPADSMLCMGLTGLALIGAAFLRPTPRTLAFIALGAVLCGRYWTIVNINLALQVVLYLMGAYSFIQNGGHDRWTGFSDHHMLHYFVTVGCIMHVFYIRHAVTHQVSHVSWQDSDAIPGGIM